jgi:tetratricopeptide (TPR) repeat protein
MEMMLKPTLPAGERALATYAHEEAMAHFERALAAKEGQPLDAETAALLSGLGRAQVATLPLYQLQEAVVTLGRAFEYYAEVGDVDRAVNVAEHPLPAAAGHFTGAGRLISRALGLVQYDSLEMGGLLASYGRVLSLEEGNYLDAKSALDKALAIARREGDVGLEMRTLVSAAEVDGYHSHWQEALDSSLRAIELIPRIDDPRTEMLARYWATLPLMIIGNPDEADLQAAAMLSPAERLRHHFYLARTLFAHTCLSQCRGNWQAARDFSDRGLAVSPREARLLGNRVLLEYELGDFSQGEDYLERLLEVVQLTAPGPTLEHGFLAIVIPAVARITGITSRFAVVEETAETILSSPSVTPIITTFARTCLALMAVQRGDAAAAGEQYAVLEPAQGTEITVILGIQPKGLLGLLAQTMGNLDQAVDHFEDSLAFCREAGYRPELAWTCCDYADTLLQRNLPGDPDKAMSLLDESLAISSELEMRPLIERVLSRREILKA